VAANNNNDSPSTPGTTAARLFDDVTGCQASAAASSRSLQREQFALGGNLSESVVSPVSYVF